MQMQGLSNSNSNASMVIPRLGSGGGTPFRIMPYLTIAKHGAACTLIEIGALRILLDCGAMEPPVFGDEQRSNTKVSNLLCLILLHSVHFFAGSLLPVFLFRQLKLSGEKIYINSAFHITEL